MSDYTVHDYQWLKDMHIDLAQSEIEISPAELLVLAEASDKITITEVDPFESESDRLKKKVVQLQAEVFEIRQQRDKVLGENAEMETEMRIGSWLMIFLFAVALTSTSVMIYIVRMR